MRNTEFFKEIDNEGIETLSVLANADKLNMWFYNTITPFCTGKILEIGSGIGNISHFFIQNKNDITLSDLRPNYITSLVQRFPEFKKTNFYLMDLVDVDFDIKHNDKFNSFDTIFALNVIEHIFDDQQAIKNCYKLLKKGGQLIILVPAYNFLYNRFDKELEHHRRYNQKTLNALFTNAGFSLIHSQYFNAMGIFGWFISGAVLNNKILPKGQVKIYNKLVPFFRIIDKILFRKIGLSVMAVGKK